MLQDVTRISLDGDWQLIYFPQGSRSIAHPDDLPAIAALPRPFLLNSL